MNQTTTTTTTATLHLVIYMDGLRINRRYRIQVILKAFWDCTGVMTKIIPKRETKTQLL